MNIKPIALLITLTLANGCTPYAESFDCPPGRGVGCKSLNIVNHMVEEGQLPLEETPLKSDALKSTPLETLSDQGKEENKKPVSSSSCLIEARDSRAPLQLVNHHASHAVPSRETHLKVWVAAYEDEEGAYHAPSFLYVALKKDSSPQSVEGKK